MITFNNFDLKNKQNVSFGTQLSFSTRRAIRKLYKCQGIPESVKTQIHQLKNDGISARIIAKKMSIFAEKKVFGINKKGSFNVEIYDFKVYDPKNKRQLWLFGTNNPKTFEQFFTAFKLQKVKLLGKKGGIVIREK